MGILWAISCWYWKVWLIKHVYYHRLHYRETVIDVELPEVEVDDGSKVSVLSVTFPDGQTIQPCSADEGHKEPFILKCKVTFTSPKPVSFTKPIKFVDTVGSRWVNVLAYLFSFGFLFPVLNGFSLFAL